MSQAGAQAFHEPIARRFAGTFAYTTVERLRAEGLGAGISDARALDLIFRVGDIINRATDQFYVAVESTARSSVRGVRTKRHGGMSRVYADSRIPILQVNSVIVDGGQSQSTVDSNDYRIDDRSIYMHNKWLTYTGTTPIGRPAYLPSGIRNVIIDGTFGWVENRPFSDLGDRFVETTTTAEVSEGDTSISVSDTSIFKVNDVVILRSSSAPETLGARVIITGITDGTTFTCDPVRLFRGQTLPSGSVAITYGQVPTGVEMAAVVLVGFYKDGLATSDAGNLGSSGRLLSETTDNYSYRLEPIGLSRSGGGSGYMQSTGSQLADQLLAEYKAPPVMGAV